MEKKKFVNEVAIFTPEMLEKVFENNFRQYIQGNLQNEQDLPHVYNAHSEIGISDYKEFTHDEPHYHDIITETNYILEGRACLKIIDTGEEYILEKGSIASVPPKMVHLMKVHPNTRVLFFKDHSINDKHVVDLDSLNIGEWLADKEF